MPPKARRACPSSVALLQSVGSRHAVRSSPRHGRTAWDVYPVTVGPSPSLDPRYRKEIADNAVEMLGVTFIWTSRSRRAGSGRRAPSGALHHTRSPWPRLVSRRDQFVALTEEQTRSAVGETSPPPIVARPRLQQRRRARKAAEGGRGIAAARGEIEAQSLRRAEMRSGSRSASHRQNATPRDEHVEANSTTLPRNPRGVPRADPEPRPTGA